MNDEFPADLLLEFAFVNLPVWAGLGALIWAATRLRRRDRVAATASPRRCWAWRPASC